MKYELNELNQPVGTIVEMWKVPIHPLRETLVGRYCRLESLDPILHAESLFAANVMDADGRSWTYLPYGPFENLADYRTWIEQYCCGRDPLFYAIVDLAKGAAVGVASYLRIAPESGSIEVGHIHFSPLLQRTPASTEAMYLLMASAFSLGYRRYEWKCNALNIPSRVAAQRLGFSFEGVFRQAAVVKGRNRDTAWYACVDGEWPAIEKAFLQWLSPTNFDEGGNQRIRLSELTAPILHRNIVDKTRLPTDAAKRNSIYRGR